MELLEHPVDGAMVQLALGERVHVVVTDMGEDLLEQPRLLIDVAADPQAPLQEPSPLKQATSATSAGTVHRLDMDASEAR